MVRKCAYAAFERAVEPLHSLRYLDIQDHRWNFRPDPQSRRLTREIAPKLEFREHFHRRHVRLANMLHTIDKNPAPHTQTALYS